MNKPSISDVARQKNSARVSKFAGSIIPSAPEEANWPVVAKPVPEPIEPEVVTETVEPPITSSAVEPTPSAEVTPTLKTARKRSGNLSLEEITAPKAPSEEAFSKMARIAEKHHDLLREIAFKHRKPMNTILYNLLEVLDQTYQRDQQKDV